MGIDLNTIASQFAEQPVKVICEHYYLNGDSEGWVYQINGIVEPVIHIWYKDCQFITKVSLRNYEDAGESLEVLAHEAMHINLNEADESIVECTTVRNAWKFANMLKLGKPLTRFIYQAMQVRHILFDKDYRRVC